jgi:hypothetical protein
MWRSVMRSRVLLLGVLAIAAAVAGADPAERKGPGLARYVDGGAQSPQLGDLAEVLHIQQLRGKAELNSGFNNVTLVLAAYKDGHKADLTGREVPLFGAYETTGTISYAVQIVDLDFLPLGDGKKGHCRLHFSFRWPDGSTGSAERDIPKSIIDLSKCSNLTFTEAASEGREVPLFWLLTGGEIPLNLKTREQVLHKVDKGNLLFVTLRFNDPEKVKGKR